MIRRLFQRLCDPRPLSSGPIGTVAMWVLAPVSRVAWVVSVRCLRAMLWLQERKDLRYDADERLAAIRRGEVPQTDGRD